MNDVEKTPVTENQEDFAAMLEDMPQLHTGQVVKGIVAQVSEDGVVVSIPGKADGYIKRNDLVSEDCKVDDEVEAEVVKLNDGEGYVLLSERKVMATKNWEKLVAEYDTGACVEATGRITNLKDKHKTRVHFDVKKMVSQNQMVVCIVNHFATKKHMMKQLGALGKVTFSGCFDVLFKKVVFAGRLGTEAGDLDVKFTVDGLNKYLYGTAATDSLQLGRVMDMKQVSEIACRTDFRIDISKQRTALMRRQKGGKLPIGKVEAEVQKVRCVLGTLHDISATIESDGAEAVGKVLEKNKFLNVYCDFSFTDTNQMHKLKVKPRLGKGKKQLK